MRNCGCTPRAGMPEALAARNTAARAQPRTSQKCARVAHVSDLLRSIDRASVASAMAFALAASADAASVEQSSVGDRIRIRSTTSSLSSLSAASTAAAASRVDASHVRSSLVKTCSGTAPSTMNEWLAPG